MERLNLNSGSDGGVEEKKEDDEVMVVPKSMRSQLLNASPIIPEGIPEEDQHDGPQSPNQSSAKKRKPRNWLEQAEDAAKFLLGSCGQAVEAASLFVQGRDCQCPGAIDSPNKNSRQPLSITEELRKLAMQEGYWQQGLEHERRADIPAFLGEDAVYSIDDDNISAISQNTLEDMARRGVVRMKRKPQVSPMPEATSSSSSSSEFKG